MNPLPHPLVEFMDNIKYSLEGQLGLVLDCFYKYEPEVAECGLNPREEVCVELDCVYLGDAPLKYDFHLTPHQWRDIEQWIFEQKAWE